MHSLWSTFKSTVDSHIPVQLMWCLFKKKMSTHYACVQDRLRSSIPGFVYITQLILNIIIVLSNRLSISLSDNLSSRLSDNLYVHIL